MEGASRRRTLSMLNITNLKICQNCSKVAFVETSRLPVKVGPLEASRFALTIIAIAVEKNVDVDGLVTMVVSKIKRAPFGP